MFLWCWGAKRTMRWSSNHNLEIFETLQVCGKTPRSSGQRRKEELDWPRDGETKGTQQLPFLGYFLNQIWPQIQSNLSLTVPCEEL